MEGYVDSQRNGAFILGQNGIDEDRRSTGNTIMSKVLTLIARSTLLARRLILESDLTLGLLSHSMESKQSAAPVLVLSISRYDPGDIVHLVEG